MPNGVDMNGNVSQDYDLSAEALFRALKPLLDPTSDAEVPANVEEAALDAVGRLGSKSAAASLFFVDESQLAHDVATLALGRAGAHVLHGCLDHQLHRASLSGAFRVLGVILHWASHGCMTLTQPDALGILGSTRFICSRSRTVCLPCYAMLAQ